MKIAVCDDDINFIEKIKLYINKYIDETDEVISFSEGKDLLDENYIDILFIDIEMPELTGFDLVDRLEDEDVIIIFVSSYNDRVYESIKYNPFRFIRKDKLDDEFEEAMLSAAYRVRKRAKEYIIKMQGSTRKVKVGDILYIESNLKKNSVILDNEVIEIKTAMKEIENDAAFDIFVRPHRSYLVNISKITKIGISNLILNNGEHIPLSRNKKNEIKEKFMKYVRGSN